MGKALMEFCICACAASPSNAKQAVTATEEGRESVCPIMVPIRINNLTFLFGADDFPTARVEPMGSRVASIPGAMTDASIIKSISEGERLELHTLEEERSGK